MSEHHLSDDSTQWPEDPYDVLGVTPEDDKRTVRKAYSRLVRRFRPDEAPEAFHQLREAYEIILSSLEFWAGSEEDDGIPTAPPLGEGADRPCSEREGGARTGPQEPDRVAEGWALAMDGDLAGSYRALRRQAVEFPSVDASQRLYWLLVASPELDPETPSWEWLFRGTESSVVPDPLARLLALHIHRHPGDAVGNAGAEARDRFGGAALLHTMRLRWQACIKRDWEQIERDLEALRDRVGDQPDDWPWLLYHAVNCLLWVEDHWAIDVAAQFREELDDLAGVSPRFHEAFDALDYGTEMIEREIRRAAPPSFQEADWFELVRLDATAPLVTCRDRVVAAATHIARNPLRGMALFDAFQSDWPLTAGRLCEVFGRFAASGLAPPIESQEDAFVVRAAHCFLTTYTGQGYRTVRPGILRMCIHEAINPEHLAMHVAEIVEETVADKEWPKCIMEDDALQIVYLACRWTFG